jgi:hypothetical protein
MLGTALPELTRAQRRTVEMAYFEGWTVEEVSEKRGSRSSTCGTIQLGVGLHRHTPLVSNTRVQRKTSQRTECVLHDARTVSSVLPSAGNRYGGTNWSRRCSGSYRRGWQNDLGNWRRPRLITSRPLFEKTDNQGWSALINGSLGVTSRGPEDAGVFRPQEALCTLHFRAILFLFFHRKNAFTPRHSVVFFKPSFPVCCSLRIGKAHWT